MLVMVRYNDDNYDIIEDYRLEYLIVTGKVTEFSRSDQWVSVAGAPTRENPVMAECPSSGNTDYSGPERRRNRQKNQVDTSQTLTTG